MTKNTITRMAAIAALIFGFGFASWAEQVTIGNLESASQFASLPFNGTYRYSYSQQIYTAEEIGTAGTINSLTVWMLNTSTNTLPTFNIDIYMKEVDKETFTSTMDWVSVNTSDIVYSGTVEVTNTTVEAFTFTFDTPFEYTGQGNLLVAFDNNTGSWDGGLRGMIFGATGDPVRTIYTISDNTNFDPLNMSGVTTNYTSPKRNVVQFDITPPDVNTLTVYDGTETNRYVPVYGYWADAYQKCEFVIPANQLADMSGGSLSKMTFYLSTPASEPWTGTFQVFLKEVNYTTLSAFTGTDGATIVYEGTLNGTHSTMSVYFDNNYTYGGGNLLVGVYETAKGNYKDAYFFGQNVEGACVQGYSSSSLNEVAATQRNFIPKTTFTYTVLPPDPCLIAVTPNAPYIEDFESPDGVPYNWAEGPVPDCWGQYTTGPALPHITNQGGALEGAQCLSFYSQGDQYAILPEFSTAINLLKISFWKKYGNGLQLGYITAADNGTCNTFTAIETYYGGGSVWTQHVTYLSDVPETAHRLVFKRPGEGSSCFIDYVEVTFFDGCYNVGTLSISDPTAHSVHLSWDLIDDSQTEWNVQVATNADFTENLVEYLADSHEDYLLNNLDGGTVYHVRVGPTCSEYWWSNTVVFVTQCDGPVTVTADAPYTQGFEDGVIPGCWDVYAPEYYDAPYVYNNYHLSHSGSYSLMFNGTSYAVLPEFSNPLDELQISFWIDGSLQLQLGYITAEDDGTCNTFTAIADYTHTPSETWVQCTNYLLNMPATAHRLAFKAYDVESALLVPIDDVEVAVDPFGSCYPVGNVSLGRAASNAAYLSWELYDAEQTAWDVQVATDAAFTENVANHVAYSHENYLVEGLDPDTYYYVRVKPSCSDDLWSNTLGFWTSLPCDGPITVTADAPYTPGRLPACWESYTTGGVGPHNATPDSEYVHGGSQSLSFRSITGDDTYVILPEFSNPLNELQISFWLRGYNQLQLGYLTAEDEGTCNTFTAIADLVVTSPEWTQHFFYLPNVPDTAHRLAIKTNENYLFCFIDDVEVSLGPDCYSVGNLSVGEVSSTSAYLSWELIDNSQTAWNVQLATDEDFTDIVAEYEADTHENYLLEGLGIATQYYVRVKPTCSNDLWNTIDFTTLCGPYEITLETPYTQGFESPEGTLWAQQGPLPPCWEGYNNTVNSAPHNTIGSYGAPNYVHSGEQSLSFNDGDAYAVLPEFSNPLNQLHISFWMKADGGGSGQLRLGYLTAEDDGTCNTFAEIATYYNNGTSSMVQHSKTLENVPATAHRLAFKWSATNYRCFVDDVEVSINPAMIPPHDIAAVNITRYEADIIWEGLCDSYALRYRQATESSWTTPDDATALADHSYTLTGLTPETSYEVQVQGTYGSTVLDWSETMTFTTMGCEIPTNLAVSSLTATSATLAWTGFSDSYNVRYRTAAQDPFSEDFEGEGVIAPGNWTFISKNNANGIGGSGAHPAGIFAVGDDGVYSIVHDGEKAFRFSSYTGIGSGQTYDQYLVSPELSVTGVLKFYHRKYIDFNECLYVGYSTTTNDVETEGVFTWSSVDLSTSWQQYTLALPADVKYVAFHYYGDCLYLVYLDDIVIDDWVSNGEWTSVEGISGLGTTLGGLQPNTPYEWQVQGVCDGEPTDWSASAYFTTLEQTTVTQTVALSAGWNWWSAYLEITNPIEMLQTLETALGENGIQIKNSDISTEYDSEWGWFGDLDEVGFTNEEMIMIKIANACTFELQGPPANPASHPITINPGWNWIGYPCAVEMTLNQAFSNFTPEVGDMVKNSEGSSEYDSEWGWFGDVENLVPGQGFMYYSNSTSQKTLILNSIR